MRFIIFRIRQETELYRVVAHFLCPCQRFQIKQQASCIQREVISLIFALRHEADILFCQIGKHFHDVQHLFRIDGKCDLSVGCLFCDKLICTGDKAVVFGDLGSGYTKAVVFTFHFAVAVQVRDNGACHLREDIQRPASVVNELIRVLKFQIVDHILGEVDDIRTGKHIIVDGKIGVFAQPQGIHLFLIPPFRVDIDMGHLVKVIKITLRRKGRDTFDTVEEHLLIDIVSGKHGRLNGIRNFRDRRGFQKRVLQIDIQPLFDRTGTRIDGIVHDIAVFLIGKEIIKISLPGEGDGVECCTAEIQIFRQITCGTLADSFGFRNTFGCVVRGICLDVRHIGGICAGEQGCGKQQRCRKCS